MHQVKRMFVFGAFLGLVIAGPAVAERFDCNASEFEGCPGGTSYCNGDYIEVEECIGNCFKMESEGPVFEGTAFCEEIQV